MYDVGGSNDLVRNRQTCRPNSHFRQRTCAGSHNGPAIRGESGEQFKSSGERNHALKILHFAALHFAVLGGMIGVREILANVCDARAAMRAGHHFFRIESMLEGPAPPDTGDRRSGIDENSVHIEEESIAAEFGHLQLVWHTRDEAATLRGGKIVGGLPTF